MHTVAVLALDGVVPFDLSAPIDAFGWARLPDGRPAYRVRVCSPSSLGEVSAGAFTVRTPYGLEALAEADTIILPGVADPPQELPPGVAEALRDAAANGTRIASVCVGAFLFAATGLLDGLRATTHWFAARELALRYPKVEVDPNVLYVDHGRFLTSAGAAAALDMCLHMIRSDYGSAIAAQAARMSVMPLEREGGQAQFIAQDLTPAPAGATLEPLLVWLEDNCADDLTLDRIAERAGLSTRTLNRRFREQTGTTPLRWLHRARVRRAQYLLESTAHPVERIAAQAGFGSPTAFRERFRKVTGTSPQGYRRAFRSREDAKTGAGMGAAQPRSDGGPGAGLRTGAGVGPGAGSDVGSGPGLGSGPEPGAGTGPGRAPGGSAPAGPLPVTAPGIGAP